jgi:hypothetical protein
MPAAARGPFSSALAKYPKITYKSYTIFPSPLHKERRRARRIAPPPLRYVCQLCKSGVKWLSASISMVMNHRIKAFFDKF